MMNDQNNIGDAKTLDLNENDENIIKYIRTINKNLLNFDKKIVCKVTLSETNIYCCLSCGIYLQGLSVSSPCYRHSIESDHHLFLKCDNCTFYILPKKNEVRTSSFKILKNILNSFEPKYNEEDLKNFCEKSYSLNNERYYIGYVGLNQVYGFNCQNVVLQALSHIDPIKNFYLLLPNDKNFYDSLVEKSVLNNDFGLIVRKMWSKNLIRNQISPKVFLENISLKNKIEGSFLNDSPKNFMIWLLHHLHSEIINITGDKHSVISKTIQGKIKVQSKKITTIEENKTVKYLTEKDKNINEFKIISFWFLTLDLPLSKITLGNLSLQEVNLTTLLKKFNGTQFTQVSSKELRSYKLLNPLPPYLLLYINRNNKKNGSSIIVKFPEILDLSSYTESSNSPINYKLIGCIKHNSNDPINDFKDENISKWSINLIKNNGEWVSIFDTKVSECQSELMFLDEIYIQIWEKI